MLSKAGVLRGVLKPLKSAKGEHQLIVKTKTVTIEKWPSELMAPLTSKYIPVQHGIDGTDSVIVVPKAVKHGVVTRNLFKLAYAAKTSEGGAGVVNILTGFEPSTFAWSFMNGDRYKDGCDASELGTREQT